MSGDDPNFMMFDKIGTERTIQMGKRLRIILKGNIGLELVGKHIDEMFENVRQTSIGQKLLFDGDRIGIIVDVVDVGYMVTILPDTEPILVEKERAIGKYIK